MNRVIVYTTTSKGKFYDICVCLATMKMKITEKMISEDLTEVEKEKYYSTRSEKKRKEFYWGRKLKNQGLKEQMKKNNLANSTNITKGILNNPLLEGSTMNYCLTISHSGEYIAVVVYPIQLLLGVDIEEIRDDKINVGVWDSSYEMTIKPNSMESNIFSLLLWTCKEALVKSLRIGLSVNFNILEVASINKVGVAYITTYRNFHELKGYTFINHNFIYTIVMPRCLSIENIKCEVYDVI